GAAVAAAVPPPPPSSFMRSPDGKWEWHPEQNSWLPVAEVIRPGEDIGSTGTAPPNVIKAEVGSVVPFSKGADAELPAPGKSQPLPSTSQVTGGDGEGGSVTVTRAKGDEVRQAIYRGEGVVQTPQGGLVQMATPEAPAPPIGPQSVIMSPDGQH